MARMIFDKSVYVPLHTITFDDTHILNESTFILQNYFAWICSKGDVPLEKVKIMPHMSSSEVDDLEKKNRLSTRNTRPEDFPVKGILLRGIIPQNTVDKVPLHYAFSYLITDTSKYDYTPLAKKYAPNIIKMIEQFKLLRIGRVCLQTVEQNYGLHKHIDSSLSISDNNKNRRRLVLKNYGYTDSYLDVDTFITYVVSETDILFYKDDTEIAKNDKIYYFDPTSIYHSVPKSNKQRVIIRIEGKGSAETRDLIEENAIKYSNETI